MKLNWCKSWHVSKYKGLEIQLTNWRPDHKNNFHISLEWNRLNSWDHPSTEFIFEVIGIAFYIKLYDIRHQEEIRKHKDKKC